MIFMLLDMVAQQAYDGFAQGCHRVSTGDTTECTSCGEYCTTATSWKDASRHELGSNSSESPQSRSRAKKRVLAVIDSPAFRRHRFVGNAARQATFTFLRARHLAVISAAGFVPQI